MKTGTRKRILSIGISMAMVISSLPGGKAKEVNAATQNNYVKALQEALYFYDANMCGDNVDYYSALSWRDNCHTDDEFYYFDGVIRKVVKSGFHDAGDHVKFGLPQAYTATILGLSYMENADVYKKYGLTKHMKNISSCFYKYFSDCTGILGNTVHGFCYQIGEPNLDHAYWGKPENQSSRKEQYYVTSEENPATDIVSETSAALALQYLNNPGDPYSLFLAERLFDYAKTNDKKIATDGPGEFYKSSSWEDDYCLAAALLCIAVGNTSDRDIYASEFKKYYSNCNQYSWLSWDNVSSLALKYGEKAGLIDLSSDPVANCLNNMKKECAVNDGYYCLSDWGSARYNCNMDALAFLSNDEDNAKWAFGQLDYILGDDNRSFVCGHTKYELHPHHRAASAYDNVESHGKEKQEHILVGALVGGPDRSGNFVNDANLHKYTEVALDYNAGYIFALSGAIEKLMKDNKLSAQGTIDDSILVSEYRRNLIISYKSESEIGRLSNYHENETEEPSSEEPSSEEPSEEPSSEEQSSEEVSSEEQSSEEVSSEEQSSEEVSSEEQSSEEVSSEEQSSEEVSSEEQSSEEVSSEEQSSEEVSSEKQSSEEVSSEEQSSEEVSSEEQSSEEVSSEEQSSEEVSSEEQSSEEEGSEYTGEEQSSEHVGEEESSEKTSEEQSSEEEGSEYTGEEQSSEKSSEEQSSEDVSSEEQSSDKESEESSKETPYVEESSEETSSEEQSSEIPSEEQSSETPSEEQSSEIPSEEQSSETPSEEQSSETPSEEQSSETSTEKQTETKPVTEQTETTSNNNNTAGSNTNNNTNSNTNNNGNTDNESKTVVKDKKRILKKGKIKINLKNKKKYKLSKKIKIKSKYAIKSITINKKKIKIKKNAKKISFKLKKYKKFLKKRKFNKIIIKDIYGKKIVRKIKIK